MVLQGDNEGYSPPFDAAIYGASDAPATPASEFTIEYDDCYAFLAFFTVADTERARALLPEGVEPYSTPMQGGIVFARYPFSTVGTYNEVISLVQVRDVEGEMAYYIPYIYVTNDAALAAGRELAGAPKKLADIDLSREGSVYEASIERPAGMRLATITTAPERRAVGTFVDALLPSPAPLLSLRHLPPIEGGDGLTQLVKWYADFQFHEDDDGRKLWIGPTDLTYHDHSAHDPIHRLEHDEILTGGYMRFDMELGVTEVQREWHR